MRIVFMGTPAFAVPSLERLVAHGYRPVAVVTGPDRPRGRGQKHTPTPVKEAARRLGIETILQPESVKDPAFAAAVAALKPDLIVVVAYRILPPAVYQTARLGAFNLHGSLLPRYRGAAPIHRAVMAGETETGVTTFFLQEKVDTGNIILQKRLSIGPDETAGEVHDRMMELGADAVLETVRLIEAGRANATPQDDRLATPAPKIFKEEARIPWDRTAAEVHNHIRGLSPQPGAWTLHGDTLLKLYRSRRTEGAGTPGTVLEAGDRLVVACGEGAVEVVELQREGHRRLPAPDFLRGYPLREGDRLH
ncbi:methionyl-tRNA formyltransferase [Rhodocaloribacter litoris]|uniref:methionyl-tRNA formyltransferase n=1 Tax=Rhodocaloribacter litoris TaxID=2558931 RepID=UPI001420BA66|nr:methionyl-tRNA formyltransferase [Rhodocaloribacter litoris]QXD16427.1 methionyl-tRNA formyltransferase [Rhodocaloribacter litoris]